MEKTKIKKQGLNKDLSTEEIKARNLYAKEIYQKNKEKKLSRRRELYHERHKKYKQDYYNENIINMKDNNDHNYIKNRKFIAEKYQENKKYLNEQSRIRNNNRYNINPNYRARSIYRSRLNYWLNGGQSEGCLELTGLGISELNEYIQSLFEPGMSWDNRSEWHIDHIKPVKLFDLTDEAKIKECYHYSNLKPMWANDNREKAGK